MIEQLHTTNYPNARHLFASDYLTLVIDSVIAGTSSGQLWADDPFHPQTALLWDGVHIFYLVGQADHLSTNQQLGNLFATQITATVRQRGIDGFKILYSSPAWEAQMGVIFSALKLTQYPRVVYTLGKVALPDWQNRLPMGYAIHPIDRAMLTDRTLGNLDDLIEEIEGCWPSQEDFLANGFGFCAVDTRENTREIICRCTAEYVSAGKCGIGIATAEKVRQQGFATLTASAFIEYCVKNQIMPYWDSWLRNTPSVATAERIGLQRLEEYNVYHGNLV